MDLIQVKQSTRYPSLYVKKYKKKVFYKNLWNLDPQLVEARGHIVNENNELVVNPPTKVFNRNENGTDINPEEKVLAVRKINGFMACATYVPELGETVVSTTGSLDSIYVDRAKEMMPKVLEILNKIKRPTTFFFEICHPDDPHIVPENIGIYLLGTRYVDDTTPYFSEYSNEVILDAIAQTLQVSRPTYGISSFLDIAKKVKNVKHEGYMVYGQTSKTVLKLKSPYYLSLKAMARKKDILTLNKKRIDEEFYPLLNYIKEDVDYFTELDEQDRLSYIRNYLENSHV